MISVIAGLYTALDESVPASSAPTTAGAFVGVVGVAIIAFFFALLDITITARGQNTALDAAVPVVLVAVIAGFKTRLTRLEIQTDYAIATASVPA